MPLYEVETTSHIMIACVADESTARSFAAANYPQEEIIRVTHRPRDAWVISKKLLGISTQADPCSVARDCLSKALVTSCTRCGFTCRRRAATWKGAQGDRIQYGARLVTSAMIARKSRCGPARE